MTSGDRVIRVAPRLMGQSRRGERQAGKSDQIDARAIARAVLRDGIGKFPSAYLDEQAMEIRLLTDHRQQQTVEITRLTNRMRWNLVILDPALEASIPARKMDFPCHLDRVARRLRTMEPSARVRIAKQQVRMIRELSRQATLLKRELHSLIAALSRAARRGGMRHDQRRDPDRPNPRCTAIPNQRALRPHGWRRANPRVLRQTRPPPAAPRGQPTHEPRAAHHRDHTRTPRPHHQGIPPTQGSRRQEPHGGPQMPQATPCTPFPPATTPATSEPNRPPGDHRERRNLRALLDIGATVAERGDAKAVRRGYAEVCEEVSVRVAGAGAACRCAERCGESGDGVCRMEWIGRDRLVERGPPGRTPSGAGFGTGLRSRERRARRSRLSRRWGFGNQGDGNRRGSRSSSRAAPGPAARHPRGCARRDRR